MKYLITSVLLAGLLVTAIAHSTEAQHVRASHAWIRTLPGTLPAGGYVVLENDADQPATLSQANSAMYASAMLHHSSTKGGVSRMTMVDALAIPAHGKIVLAPAGYHLMLMQPVSPVKPGDVVQVTLIFADGSRLPTDFIARPANALDDGSAENAAN